MLKHTLIIPVNITGVVTGKLLQSLNYLFPNNFKAYKQACSNNKCEKGKVFIYEEKDYRLINFPVKSSYKDFIDKNFIKASLEDLVKVIKYYEISELLLPKFTYGLNYYGCETLWKEILDLFEIYLKNLDCTYKVIYIDIYFINSLKNYE